MLMMPVPLISYCDLDTWLIQEFYKFPAELINVRRFNYRIKLLLAENRGYGNMISFSGKLVEKSNVDRCHDLARCSVVPFPVGRKWAILEKWPTLVARCYFASRSPEKHSWKFTYTSNVARSFATIDIVLFSNRWSLLLRIVQPSTVT